MARKTARQKAEEELALATRVYDRAKARAEKADADLKESQERYDKLLTVKSAEATAANEALQEAKDRKEFLATHPALAGGDDDGLL